METSSRLRAVPKAMYPCRFGDENARAFASRREPAVVSRAGTGNVAMVPLLE